MCVEGFIVPEPRRNTRQSDYQRSDINRLLKALRYEETDRAPFIEYRVSSKSVYEYVLERELKVLAPNERVCERHIAPDDDVEFALRLGMDAVLCEFSWLPSRISSQTRNGNLAASHQTRDRSLLRDLEPPPRLASQLSCLEQYLRDAQGTGVGVGASFSSFFDSAWRVMRLPVSLDHFADNQPLLEELMDTILEHQERVMQAVCNRFADDLAFVMISDNVANDSGITIPEDQFIEIFVERMRRLIAPAKEHGKLLLMRVGGKLNALMPILHDIGFDAIHPVLTESDDICQLKQQFNGRMALLGGIPTSLLNHGNRESIEKAVADRCARLGPGSGYVLSSSTGVLGDIPPENLVAMSRAVHKYGRYDLLEGSH